MLRKYTKDEIIAGLRKALEFYADPSSDTSTDISQDHCSGLYQKRGQRARDALNVFNERSSVSCKSESGTRTDKIYFDGGNISVHGAIEHATPDITLTLHYGQLPNTILLSLPMSADKCRKLGEELIVAAAISNRKMEAFAKDLHEDCQICMSLT